MCTAAARLSRRHTCHCSCARIASRCAWSRRSESPSGHSKTGRAIPKIPGSREALDHKISRRFRGPAIAANRCSASTSRPSRNGAAFRTVAEIRRQRTSHKQATTRNPQSHTAKRIGTPGVARGRTVEGLAPRSPESTAARKAGRLRLSHDRSRRLSALSRAIDDCQW